MDGDLRETLRILDAAAARAAARGRCVLDEAYLRAVQRVLDLPESQDGADKSWVGELAHAARRHFRAAQRV